MVGHRELNEQGPLRTVTRAAEPGDRYRTRKLFAVDLLCSSSSVRRPTASGSPITQSTPIALHRSAGSAAADAAWASIATRRAARRRQRPIRNNAWTRASRQST